MAVIFIINALVLWIYSAYLKKLPFIGNLTISVLTASSVVVIWFANKWFINFSLPSSSFFVNTDLSDTIVMVYVFFALWSNLIREIIKDIEDFEGDQKYGGNTIPIAFGRTIAVRLTTGLSVFMIVMLFQPLVWMWQEARLIFLFHTIGLVIFPLVLLIRELLTASQKSDFHRASSLIKLIMMLGVLSMIWFLL